jgi:hypothetical protein
VATGLVEEDVVERRLHEVQVLDQDVGVVEGADDRRDGRGSLLEGDDHGAVLGRQGLAEARQDVLAHVRASLGEVQLEPRLPDLCLELTRRALRRHQAVVDDPDAVG